MKKMRSMILCTGIKGVGHYDGEFVIHIVPGEFYAPELMAVACKDDVAVFMDHAKKLHTTGGFSPFSYSLAATGDRPDLLRLARCLAMLGLFTQAQLDARMNELDAQSGAKNRLDRVMQAVAQMAEFGVVLTAKQKQQIERHCAQVKKVLDSGESDQ